MASVYLDSPTNSTFFTTCCSAALTDRQANCPACGVEIRERTEAARWEAAYGPIRRGGGYGRPVYRAAIAKSRAT